VTAAGSGRAKAYVVLIIVFVVGGLTGAGVSYSLAEEHYVHPPGREQGKRWEKRRADAFARELDLSKEQKRKIGQLMREQRQARHDAMEKMFQDCGADLREQKEALDGKILELLNPAQQARFKELSSEHGRRFFFDSHRGRHGGKRGKKHRRGRDHDHDHDKRKGRKQKQQEPGEH